MTRPNPVPRRQLLLTGGTALIASLAGCITSSIGAAVPGSPGGPASLINWANHPLLVQAIYSKGPTGAWRPDGAAGLNFDGFRFIEYQRLGAEWILAGTVLNQPKWVLDGWKVIDFGLAQQQSDGGFLGGDPHHSASLFLEAAARAALVDPSGATPLRLDALQRAAHWLCTPEAERAKREHSGLFTHRRYVMAACLGQIGRLAGDGALNERAVQWAQEGIGLQTVDGTNPERGGWDISYQMAGVLFALRYLPTCRDVELAMALRASLVRAVQPALARQRADGSLDAEGSTRIGSETLRGGQPKTVNYREALQALVYGVQALNQPDWLEPARRIARFNQWI